MLTTSEFMKSSTLNHIMAWIFTSQQVQITEILKNEETFTYNKVVTEYRT